MAPVGSLLLVHALEPRIDVPLRLVLGIAVALLQPAGELGALAFDHVEVVIGELAPLLLRPAFELFPIALHTIPIHHFHSCCRGKSLMMGEPAARTDVPARGNGAPTDRDFADQINDRGVADFISATPEITGRARGGGNGRPVAM